MLGKDAAKSELLKVMDRDSNDYPGDPENNDEAIDMIISMWKEVLSKCSEAVVPASTTNEAAKTEFESIMNSTFKTGYAEKQPADLLIAFQNACLAFAVKLGIGMTGFTATPPPAPYSPVGGPVDESADAADYMADALQTWFETGIAVNNASGASIPWS